MKRIGILIAILLLCMFVSVKAHGYESSNECLNTLNFKEKYSDIKNIKMICTYDFCDYIRSENIINAMNIFTNRYLNTLKDEEIKNSLKVKGIKITKIIIEK